MARDVLTRARRTAAAGAAGAALAFAAACQTPPGPDGRASAELDLEPRPEALGSVRRPVTTYRMVRTGERCEVVLEQGGREIRRIPKRYACPKELELGEWIRVTGMVCVRESADPALHELVPCPDYLTNAERDHRLELASAGRSTLDPEAPPPPPTAPPSANASASASTGP